MNRILVSSIEYSDRCSHGGPVAASAESPVEADRIARAGDLSVSRFAKLLLLFPVVAGCQLPNSPLIDLHMKDDQRAAAKGRWDTVRGSVKLQLAQEHFKAGRLEDAEKSLGEAMALSPHDAQAHVLLTQIRLERGQLGEAREAIALAAMLKPDDAQVQFLAGMVAQRYGDMTTAFEHYSVAANIAPHEVSYLLAQAEVLVIIEKPVDALELIEPRLVDFDQNVSLRLLAARITRILGLREPAIGYSREAVRLSNNDPELATELGLTLVWAERLPEAIAVLAPIVEKAARVQVAKPVPKRGDRAKRADTALTVTPSTVHALARALVATGRTVDAMKVLTRIMQECPEDVNAWRLYAHAAVKVGDLEKASEALQTLRDRAAMTSETWLLAGYVSLRRGDLSGARDAAQRAVDLENGLAEAYFLLGEASEALGQFSDARTAYEDALKHDPELTVAERRLSALSMGASLFGVDTKDDCASPIGDVQQ